MPLQSIRRLAVASLAGITLLPLATARAADIPPPKTYPVKTPLPAPAKNQQLRFSVLEQGVDNNFRAWMLRLDYRHKFTHPDSPSQGFILDTYWQHMIGTNPALLRESPLALTQQQTGVYANFNELSIGTGYHFNLGGIGVIPQAHFRDLFAIGRDVHQHLIGLEPGVRLEYWLYPEVTRISVDYGLTVPFAHLANFASSSSPFSLSSHRLHLEMSYRLLNMADLVVGFQWWQAPAEMGTGAINTTVMANFTGFHVGVGGAF